jgi:hypothetical protein
MSRQQMEPAIFDPPNAPAVRRMIELHKPHGHSL